MHGYPFVEDLLSTENAGQANSRRPCQQITKNSKMGRTESGGKTRTVIRFDRYSRPLRVGGITYF